ncbi:MAG: hypothetical protein OEY59_04265 [Deltaproteobacteria bacterium]|nr:hypothetical protein [Deltaproteobacteria bacterium]
MYQGLSLDQSPPEDIPFRFFLTAPFFGIIAGLYIAFEGSLILKSSWDLNTIILTHLITLGWVAMVMFGAFYQMIPVLVGGSVTFIGFSRLIHLLYILGIISLVIGLYTFYPFFLISGVSLLTISILGFVIQAAIALLLVKAAQRPTIWAMRISVLSLFGTLSLGFLLIGNLAGWWHIPISRGNLIGMHITMGLFGWIGTLIMGVGFHVIPMFYITVSFPLKVAYQLLTLQVIFLVAMPIGLFLDLDNRYLSILGLPGAVSMILFCGHIYNMIKTRKRKLKDSTILYWQTGLVFLLLSLVCVFLFLWLGDQELLIGFAAFFLIGFSISLTSGMLFKIVPFVIWFHRCSNMIGQPDIPLMKDILSNKLAIKQWWVYLASAILLIGGLFSGLDLVVRLGGLAFLVSSLMLLGLLSKAYLLKVTKTDMTDFMKSMELKKD